MQIVPEYDFTDGDDLVELGFKKIEFRDVREDDPCCNGDGRLSG